MPPIKSEVNQSSASAGGDIVGGDKIEAHYHPPGRKLSKLEELKIRLRKEVDGGVECGEIIERLLRFQSLTPLDGVVGLEAKLQVSGRSDQLLAALEMKEEFAKELERWSLYQSAQEIFVHLLAMAEYKYRIQIFPRIGELQAVEIDELIDEKIISPAIDEVGVDVFSLDHKTAMGMVYWLADQCRVRWHK